MAEFDALREALLAWIIDAMAFLSDNDAAYEGLDIPAWRCDGDGIFRNIARPLDAWDFRKRRQLTELASWTGVEQAFHEDERLSRQVGTLIGTVHGGRQIEIYGLAMHVLPCPSELGRSREVFEHRYAELEAYLLADELEFKAVWPVPGLILTDVPIELEPGVVLDAMSDHELVLALGAGHVHPPFPGEALFQADLASRACVRYRYRLPKLVGPRDDRVSRQWQDLYQRLQDIWQSIEESFTLALPEPVMTAGQLTTTGEQWSTLSVSTASEN
jgi:hypothetical protein